MNKNIQGDFHICISVRTFKSLIIVVKLSILDIWGWRVWEEGVVLGCASAPYKLMIQRGLDRGLRNVFGDIKKLEQRFSYDKRKSTLCSSLLGRSLFYESLVKHILYAWYSLYKYGFFLTFSVIANKACSKRYC